jgi:hypothetical protein
LSSNNRKRAFRALRAAIARLGREDLVAVVGIEHSLVFYSDFLYDRLAVDRILDEVAKVSMEFSHYEPVPKNVADAVIAEVAKSRAAANA